MNTWETMVPWSESWAVLPLEAPIYAAADTHPKDGDAKQAPLVSGAVPHADEADARNVSRNLSPSNSRKV